MLKSATTNQAKKPFDFAKPPPEDNFAKSTHSYRKLQFPTSETMMTSKPASNPKVMKIPSRASVASISSVSSLASTSSLGSMSSNIFNRKSGFGQHSLPNRPLFPSRQTPKLIQFPSYAPKQKTVSVTKTQFASPFASVTNASSMATSTTASSTSTSTTATSTTSSISLDNKGKKKMMSKRKVSTNFFPF